MPEFDHYMAHIAECEQKAKTARSENDKHSWLAMADSWRCSAELAKVLQRQANPRARAVA